MWNRLASLIDTLVGEAIPTGPVGALRARFSGRIVNALLVGAANNAIGGSDGFDAMFFQEGDYLRADVAIDAYVNVLGEPTLHRVRLRMFIADNGDNDFGGKIGGRAIAGDRGDGKTAKSPSRFFLQPFLR